MNAVVRSVCILSAGGAVMTLAETLLPRAEIRKPAQIAIGLLFLELLAKQICGIFS